MTFSEASINSSQKNAEPGAARPRTMTNAEKFSILASDYTGRVRDIVVAYGNKKPVPVSSFEALEGTGREALQVVTQGILMDVTEMVMIIKTSTKIEGDVYTVTEVGNEYKFEKRGDKLYGISASPHDIGLRVKTSAKTIGDGW